MLVIGVWADEVIKVLTVMVVGVSVDALTNMENIEVAAVVTASKFAMPTPFEEFNFLAALDCRPMAALDCDHILQTWMPSRHVCSTFALPAPPQFLNHEPPRPQQLFFPDFEMIPHLRHAVLRFVVVTPGVHMWVLVNH